MMADGTDEGGARAAAMGEWIVWEAEEKVLPGALICIVSFPFFYFVRGARTPRFVHSATPRVEDFLCCSRRRGQRPVSFVYIGCVPYIP